MAMIAEDFDDDTIFTAIILAVLIGETSSLLPLVRAPENAVYSKHKRWEPKFLIPGPEYGSG